MADKTDENKSSIFQKVLEAGSAMLEAQIQKSRNSLEKKGEDDSADFVMGKAITRDTNNYLGSQGYQEKPTGLSFDFQRQMALKSSVVAAIIKTRQNRVAAFSEYVPEGNKTGFRIKLKHEQDELEAIKEELFGAADEEVGPKGKGAKGKDSAEDNLADAAAEVKKAGPVGKKAQALDEDQGGEGDTGDDLDPDALDSLSGGSEDDFPEEGPSEADQTREAKKELEKRTKKKKKALAELIRHCGELEDRPFESKKWSFDAFLRAVVWDSLVYDQIAVEMVPKEAAYVEGKLNVHHFYPVDGATIRFASPELSKYKNSDMFLNQDILYPEEELKALEQRDALELDDKKLEDGEYKYVQIIRGRIQRAFTEDELKIGMRNATADIYVNGYSISELEMLVALITSHLQTEFYNRSYFQQGFSAKGILHIKSNLNRSKLEELRRHWNHMVKGNRNSFQTPIMAGMDEVQWIPLTQSHSEMEFSMWLNYLIKMICAIYQIDPSEIGYGIRDESTGGGGGLSGDNTKEKLQNSKDKGFTPLMKFMQDFINKNVIDILDPDYMLEWVGLEDESDAARIERQEQESGFKKTINEVRAEDGLPPIPGCDQLVLNPVFFQWFSQFSEEGKKLQQQQQAQQQQMPGEEGPDPQEQWEANEASAENDHARGIEGKLLDHQHALEQAKVKAPKPGMKKSRPMPRKVKVEIYRMG